MRFVFFDIDSLRASHLGCYGYHRVTSPAIDSLAERGALFTSCHASDLPCLPSRTALFSGRLGAHNGVVGHAGTAARMPYPGDGHRTDPARLPLVAALSACGYRTASFSSFAQRHLAWHFCAGWDELCKPGPTTGHETADEVTAPVLDWLDRSGRRDDWFLHVNFWDPHTPYRTPEAYGNPFADDPPPDWMTAERLERLRDDYGPRGARDLVNRNREFELPRTPRAMASLDDYKTWIDAYDVGLRYADDHVGLILAKLDELGVLDDTFVIASADHGECQGELNVFGDHATADDATARVPLVIAGPGVRPGRHEGLVYQLDLAPTVCEAAGVPVPEQWDGTSFMPALAGSAGIERPYLVIGQGAWTCQRAVRTPSHLLIRTYHAGLQSYPDVMLFDLEQDPHETENLAASHPELTRELDHYLTEWWQSCFAGPNAAPDPMLTVLAEGGPYYPQLVRGPYVEHLRRTGRDALAAELDARFAAPADASEYAPTVIAW
jgi:arylsulfatase A-like enzyme